MQAFRLLVVFFILIAVSFYIMENPAKGQEIPALTGRINDYAGVLSSNEKNQLENKIKNMETRFKDGRQLVFLTVKSLEGNDIAAYCNLVFKEWKIGSGQKNNGILTVLSTGDRKIRIEVGYGLESTITDSRAQDILKKNVVPSLTKGKENYYQAFNNEIDVFNNEFKTEGE